MLASLGLAGKIGARDEGRKRERFESCCWLTPLEISMSDVRGEQCDHQMAGQRLNSSDSCLIGLQQC